jgi:hypothetical protein
VRALGSFTIFGPATRIVDRWCVIWRAVGQAHQRGNMSDNTIARWGPWQPDSDPAERTARCHILRALAFVRRRRVIGIFQACG